MDMVTGRRNFLDMGVTQSQAGGSEEGTSQYEIDFQIKNTGK